MRKNTSKTSWLEKPISSTLSKITIEHVIIFVIILLTLFSRFYGLDQRVMSHDETNHVVPSYELFIGRGYRHDPVTHGPFQFHIVALTYFLMGDNDFTSRVPAALFSSAAVAFVLIFFRRYLGKLGGILAGLFFMISPYMLFYGRYTRNEAFIMLFGVAMLYAILRYLEDGKHHWLYLLTLSLTLHFCAKETAYIYAAEILIFLGGLTLYDLFRHQWQNEQQKRQFILSSFLVILLFFASIIISIVIIRISKSGLQTDSLSSSPITDLSGTITQLIEYLKTYGAYYIPILIPLVIGLILLVLFKNRLTWDQFPNLRSFHLLVLVATLVLPLLSPIFSKLAGIDPIDYTNQMGIYITFIFILYISAASVIFGTAWEKSVWLKSAALFYTIFIVFYTTIFTNGFGFFTGIVGGLGYWLAQHGLQRGNQPLYYYALIQLPIYEYLAACGTVLAFYFGIRFKQFWSIPQSDQTPKKNETHKTDIESAKPVPVLWLLLFWSIASLITFSIAGEKMPWLTVHIALPLLLCAGWAIGFLIKMLWNKRKINEFWLTLGIAFLFVFFLGNILIILLGSTPPFAGKTQVQLQRTNYFLLTVCITVACGSFIYKFSKNFSWKKIGATILLAFFGLLTILTSRTAYFASFVNFDYPFEFLVYAHAAPGPKEILSQVEEISQRTTQGLAIKVAYDNNSRYPFWWYFRHFPNRMDYSENPTKSLEEYPIIISGQPNYSKIDPIVRNNYYTFEYMRLWWPMMDYYYLNPQRIWDSVRNGEMRQALFNIWLNRDYSFYSKITGNNSLTLETWSPAEKMRLYIRKDIAAQIWNLGVSTSVTGFQSSDPYAEKTTKLQPSRVISGGGSGPGLLAAPRGIAVGLDDTIYVADSYNHRIQHFTQEGKLINSWGTYANILNGEAPAGTFNEPWGIAVGPDGSVYVTDTWNYRIQKFTAQGQFIKMWGTYNINSSQQGLYGPRGILVTKNGHVFVTDTGNKRVVIFDSDGNFMSQFGSVGMDPGNFDEPVGIAMDKEGKIYIADTWNHRIQVFMPDSSGLNYTPLVNWNIDSWYGQSMNNKPFLAIGPGGNLFVTDPEGSRIFEFSNQGELIRAWTGFNLSEDIASQPNDLKFDSTGKLWVTDATSNLILVFENLGTQSAQK
jgi:predicted membrane-bound mannosyltransferase/sugar lactone lactonase YvrE